MEIVEDSSAPEGAISRAAPSGKSTQIQMPRVELDGLKLDLGAGVHPREGFEAVDLYVDAPHRVNLWQFPWPFEDDSCAALHCAHFIEHIPACYWSPDNTYPLVPRGPEDRDLFVRFMDECYRVLKHDGRLMLIWPALQSARAFQDPTHRRFIPLESMWYLNRKWREANGLEHYLGACHFEMVSSGFSPSPVLEQQGVFSHPEAVSNAVYRNWNLAADLHAELRAVKYEEADEIHEPEAR
jgi:SAM-dependent methyltransferase